MKRIPLQHDSLWSSSLEIVENAKLAARLDTEKDTTVRGGGVGFAEGGGGAGGSSAEGEDGGTPRESAITSLNLAHNSFSVAPRCLACLTPSLARLNLSYNSISRIGSVSAYPLSLKHLDLGYNQISGWPGSTGTTAGGGTLSSENLCYAAEAVDPLSSVELSTSQQQQLESKKYSR